MMSPYREIIANLLEEVDADIRELMLKNDPKENMAAYMFLTDPANTILGWQAMRDRKKEKEKKV
jgi:hypothetical protein